MLQSGPCTLLEEEESNFSLQSQNNHDILNCKSQVELKTPQSALVKDMPSFLFFMMYLIVFRLQYW